MEEAAHVIKWFLKKIQLGPSAAGLEEIGNVATLSFAFCTMSMIPLAAKSGIPKIAFV
jgi:hypothetical protein